MIKDRLKNKQNIKTAKGRAISSTKWLERHINDPYVQMAKEHGYRSRAAYKLLQIDDKFGILRDSTVSIDLGCAPGGWLQVIATRAKKSKKIIGMDLQEIKAPPGVITIVGDIFAQDTKDELAKIIPQQADLIVSDMAASSCGNTEVDHLKSIALVEESVYFAFSHLRAGGNFVAKCIRGGQEQLTLQRLRKIFNKVYSFKPDASYSTSSEFYFVCLSFKPTANPFE
jgi:23S rRNA (uridine2552-2'-O)-methyltransferase